MIGRQALTPIALYKSTGGKRTSEVWEVCHRNPGVQGVISTSLEGERLSRLRFSQQGRVQIVTGLSVGIFRVLVGVNPLCFAAASIRDEFIYGGMSLGPPGAVRSTQADAAELD